MSRLMVAGFLTILALAPQRALAHGLLVTCKVQGAKVEVQVFYDDDTDAAMAKVQIFNAKEEVIAKGSTDARGRCSFDAPPAGKYVVHADAGAGHRAKKELIVPEMTSPSESNQQVETTKPVTAPTNVTNDPTREELTRTPWLKIGIGLTTIVVLGGAFVIATKMRNART